MNASVAARALSANLNSPPSQPERQNGFRRCVSFFGNETSQALSTEPRRVSLPSEVLRADDGTFVRGRFGGRASGYGIGSRGLDGHPMQKTAAAARETKNNNDDDSIAVPRQRPRA